MLRLKEFMLLVRISVLQFSLTLQYFSCKPHIHLKQYVIKQKQNEIPSIIDFRKKFSYFYGPLQNLCSFSNYFEKVRVMMLIVSGD